MANKIFFFILGLEGRFGQVAVPLLTHVRFIQVLTLSLWPQPALLYSGYQECPECSHFVMSAVVVQSRPVV